MSFSPLNENDETNRQLFRNHFNNRCDPNSIESLVEKTLDNLKFLHSKILPLKVGVAIQIPKIGERSKDEKSLYEMFCSGYLIQIRPTNFKTTPNQETLFLGAVFVFPSFELSKIVHKDEKRDSIDFDKCEIEYVTLKGPAVLPLFSQNMLKITETFYSFDLINSTDHKNDPRLIVPNKIGGIKTYLDLIVAKNVKIRDLLRPIGVTDIKSPIFIHQPWITLNQAYLLKVIHDLPNIRILPKSLKYIWPLKKMESKIDDKIFIDPLTKEQIESYKEDQIVKIFHAECPQDKLVYFEGIFTIGDCLLSNILQGCVPLSKIVSSVQQQTASSTTKPKLSLMKPRTVSTPSSKDKTDPIDQNPKKLDSLPPVSLFSTVLPVLTKKQQIQTSSPSLNETQKIKIDDYFNNRDSSKKTTSPNINPVFDENDEEPTISIQDLSSLSKLDTSVAKKTIERKQSSKKASSRTISPKKLSQSSSSIDSDSTNTKTDSKKKEKRRRSSTHVPFTSFRVDSF